MTPHWAPRPRWGQRRKLPPEPPEPEPKPLRFVRWGQLCGACMEPYAVLKDEGSGEFYHWHNCERLTAALEGRPFEYSERALAVRNERYPA